MNDETESELIARVEAMIAVAKELNRERSREESIRRGYRDEIIGRAESRPVEIEQ